MEIESEDGSRIVITNGSKKEFGRGLGFPLDDRTVSRHHISFELLSSARKDQKETTLDSEPMVSFEVLGKNPIWVFSSSSGEIRVFRKFDKGEVRGGDRFCVSAKKPILFTLKRIGFEGPEAKERSVSKAVEGRERISQKKEMVESVPSGDGGFKGDGNFGLESLDLSDIAPFKEFGFVVMGHEFDQYPKQMIRDIKDWQWYLEEQREDSEDDECHERNRSKGKKGVRRKKKKDEGNDDDDWMGESEDDKVLIAKIRKAKRPKYSTTRSKNDGKTLKDMSSKKLVQKKTVHANGGEDDEDEDTVGGLIVNDDDLEAQEEEEEEEEEEEDYDDGDEAEEDDEEE